MDLSVSQEVIKMHQRYETKYGSHVFKLQDVYEETDITGNNNFFNSLKTETSSDHAHNPSPLFQVKYNDDKDFKVDNSLFSYSSFKKAMDLRIHNRTVDGGKRTIFDDAEYFARNCCYKLLPITFEQVDETIIHTEHNYSLCSLNSESEPEEDCSRTMDYSQIKEKNYKKRKTKCRQSTDQEEVVIHENCQDNFDKVSVQPGVSFVQQPQDQNLSHSLEEENPFAGQPLDLSAAPVVQEEKTESLSSSLEETGQPDSDKENVSAALSGIRVTITRPDEKENYQPCDMFLNDIARLVPWLIDKDCFEVEILDRTCDRHDEILKHRLYYVIAESTWRSFQSTNERIILTNDRSLGEPVRQMEKGERPSYLVFDQLSLAKCLAEYSQEIGGCFEYRCVEEEANGRCLEEKLKVMEEAGEEKMKTVKTVEPEGNKPWTMDCIGSDAVKEEIRTEPREKREKEDLNEAREKEENMTRVKEEEAEKAVETTVDESVGSIGKAGVEGREESRKENCCDVSGASQESDCLKETLKSSEEVTVDLLSAVSETQRFFDVEKAGQCFTSSTLKKVSEEKEKKVRTRKSRQKKKSPVHPKTKKSGITTRSMSTPETSQKSKKRVSKKEERKRRYPMPSTQEPPGKRKRTSKSEEVDRSRRTVVLPLRAEAKAERTTAKKRSAKQENDSQKETRGREKISRVENGRKRKAKRKDRQNTGRSLRSGAASANEKRKPPVSEKGKSSCLKKSRKR